MQLVSATQYGVSYGMEDASFDVERAAGLAPVLRMLNSTEPSTCVFATSKEVLELVDSEEALMQAGQKGLRPVLYLSADDQLQAAFEGYCSKNGKKPFIVAVKGLGVFALGGTKQHAQRQLDCFIRTAVKGEALESPCEDCAGSDPALRLRDKVSIITGSAQGFGKGVAEVMAKQGAYVVIADMNYAGAQALAAELCDTYGAGVALPVEVNVTDEESVKRMIDTTVLHYGGLDIFVNNAGIVRSGGLEVMDKKSFELVTSVNYTAYFLCVKYASIPMKLQHSVNPDYLMDIIEVNSKSGLSGSNKNFAYAGSKFGGIGLTQSFALELVPYNIKVNAICPGNFLDGPLWSDPERGLFVQYLKAGKVPGAKTVADVKEFYESKVPMHRGCTTDDVAVAILYVVEQKYETGQAIPVTGGQEMLK